MERLTVKTGVYQNGKLEIIVGMKCGVEFKDIFDRLAAIEDILGDEYDLDRLRELKKADDEGRCVVFQPGYALVSIYNTADEDGLYTMKATGVITKAEYEAALRREQDG